ncbi:hypothetical protein [Promicromonospora soli]
MAKSVVRVVAAVSTAIALTFGFGSVATAVQSEHSADATVAGERLDVGIMVVDCTVSTGRGNPGGVPYAYYARSTCSGETAGDVFNNFRVKFRCSGESSDRYGPWTGVYEKRSTTSQGWCPYPKTVTSVGTQIENIGP